MIRPRRRDRIQAALELSSWSETRGVSAVSFDEHHQSGHGWSSNPIMTAAVLLARTERVVASVDCALGPLWHPVRLAEDIALADTIGGGRLIVTLGLGYRPVEYELFGTPFNDRGHLMDDLLETLMSLWASPEFTPGPLTRPHPTVFVGGSVRATARRAARHGLPLNLPSHLPELADHYRELCADAGHAPIVVMPPPRSRGMVFLHEDPDRAWAELGEHYLWEARVYSGWGGGEVHSFMHGTETRNRDCRRRQGRGPVSLHVARAVDRRRQSQSARSHGAAPARRRHANRRGVEIGPTTDRRGAPRPEKAVKGR